MSKLRAELAKTVDKLNTAAKSSQRAKVLQEHKSKLESEVADGYAWLGQRSGSLQRLEDAEAEMKAAKGDIEKVLPSEHCYGSFTT